MVVSSFGRSQDDADTKLSKDKHPTTMTEEPPKSALVSYVRSSIFMTPGFRKSEGVDAAATVVSSTTDANTLTAATTTTSSNNQPLIAPHEVPYGCFWNHSLTMSDEKEDETTLSASAAETPGCSMSRMSGSTRSTTNSMPTNEQQQPSPTMSATSNQTSLAGGHILDGMAGTSAFMLPIKQQHPSMRIQTSSSSPPAEIQVASEQQPPTSTRSHLSRASQEGFEVEASPRYGSMMIQPSSTFESLSSDGSSTLQQNGTPNSHSTTSTASIPGSFGFQAAKRTFESKFGGSVVKGDPYGDIRQAHTETTASTNGTRASRVHVRELHGSKDDDGDDEAVDTCEEPIMEELLAADVASKLSQLDISTATADSDADFFSEMLDVPEEQPEQALTRDNGHIVVATSMKTDPLPIADDTEKPFADPFDWAYDVWKRKGLMAGEPFAPPRERPSIDHPRSPANSRAAHFKMDLSGVDDMPVRSAKKKKKDRFSLPAVPVSAKKPGFDIILNRWRQKSDESSFPTFLNQAAQGQNGVPTAQEPKQHMGVRNQIIVASHAVSVEPESMSRLENEKVAGKPAPPHKTTDDLKMQKQRHLRPEASPIPQSGTSRPQSSGSVASYYSRGSASVASSCASSSKPVSQASRLVSQLSKQGREGEGKEKSQRLATRSPQRSSQNFKTTVHQFLEDNSVLEQVRSRKENVETKMEPFHGISLFPQRKIATITRKNAKSDDSGVSSCLLVRKSPEIPATGPVSAATSSQAFHLHTTHRSTMPSIVEEMPRDEVKDQGRASLQPLLRGDVKTDESHFETDSTATPSIHASAFTSASAATRLISSDSPWKALLRMDEDASEVTPQKKPDARRPWNRDVVIHKTYQQSFSPGSEQDDVSCNCSSSVFSTNDEMVSFMLPLMGMACTCGKKITNSLRNPEEPTALENILRPWQCEFLAAFGIFRGDQLVKAHHRSAGALASALRRYRKKHGMKAYPTESCAMALSIWSKTSKAFVRSIRKQMTSGFVGELKVPNTLYIISSFMDQMPSDRPEAICQTSAQSHDERLQPTFGEDFAEL